jgi:CheY-like chemotaxis protein
MDTLNNNNERNQRFFLNKMSHDVLRPMNTIMNMAELSLRENNPETLRGYNIAIKQAAQSLLSLFSDMMDFSKFRFKKDDIRPVDYYFSTLINDVVSVIKMRALHSGLRFLVNIDKNIPQVLNGDYILIRQILIYLLSNAARYTQQGFGSFSLTVVGEIYDEDTVFITVEIADSGQGMDEEGLKRLFEAKPDIKTEESHFKLPVVLEAVRAMGGDIRAVSKYGEGTTFNVFLPQKINRHEILAKVENSDAINVLIYERRKNFVQSIICTLANLGVAYTTVTNPEDYHEKIISGEYSFIFVSAFLYERDIKTRPNLETEAKIVLIEEFGDAIPDHGFSVLSTPIYTVNVANLLNAASDAEAPGAHRNQVKRFTAPNARVLLVDDMYTNLQAATRCLLPYNMQVDLCLDGADALFHIKNNPYDLVFVDPMMPENAGTEISEYVRGETPVLAFTAGTASVLREQLSEIGIKDYIPLPIDTVRLNILLEEWLPKEKLVYS